MAYLKFPNEGFFKVDAQSPQRLPLQASIDKYSYATFESVSISIRPLQLELGELQPSLTTILKLSAALKYPAHDLIALVETELLKEQ